MTEKKKYEKPSMQVFELKQQTQLLAGSTTGNMNDPADYNDGGDPLGF